MSYDEIEARLAKIAAMAAKLTQPDCNAARNLDRFREREQFVRRRAAELEALGEFKQAENYRVTCKILSRKWFTTPVSRYDEDE